MLEEVVLATKNEGKIREFRVLLDSLFGKMMSLRDFESVPEIVEDGSTFAENALKKARIVCELTQKITLADDSGLEVQALGGKPGIFSARYAGKGAADKENIKKLLGELDEEANRKARFVCSLALAYPGGKEITVESSCEGLILSEPRGDGGFGYDPVFFLPELKKTMAELTTEEKNLISHRARAVNALALYLNGQKSR